MITTDPQVLTLLTVLGSIVGAWFASRAAHSKVRHDTIIAVTQIEAEERRLQREAEEKIKEREQRERAEYRQSQRDEIDSLRKRIRSTEEDLSHCLKKHAIAEIALLRAGIPLPEEKG